MEGRHNYITNPWVGPSSYQDPQKSVVKFKFCGRESEIYDLVHLIDENFLVTLYGKSGNGKTSLLQAGVFPVLRREQYLPVILRLGMIDYWETFPIAIIRQIEQTAIECGGNYDVIPVIPEQTNEQAVDYLWNYFARHRFYDKSGQVVFPVIVFDQFEEVLRSRNSIKKTEVLLSQLNYIIDESHALSDCLIDNQTYIYDFNFRFVISIREDELYRLEDCIDNIYLSALKRCRYRLNALKEEDAEVIITIPGVDVINQSEQSEIVSRIISSATNNEDGNISPFMLSLICSELFNKAARINATAPLITSSMINELGDNILHDFYLNVVSGLSESERIFLEDNLVDATGNRNCINRDYIDIHCPSWHKLSKEDCHILQTNGNKVELIHDKLANIVYSCYKLRQQEIKIQSKIKKRNRIIIWGLIWTCLIISVVTIVIFIIQNKKISELNDEMLEFQSRAIAMKAIELFEEGDTCKASLLALYAMPANLKDPTRPYTTEAELAIRTICKDNELVLIGHKGEINHVSFSSDDKYLYSASNDKTIKMWNTITGKEIKSFIGHNDRVNTAYSNFNGNKVISASNDGTIRIWDTHKGTQLYVLDYSPSCVSLAMFSPMDNYIASLTNDTVINLWDTNAKKKYLLKGHTGIVNYISFLNDSTLLSADDNMIRVWDLVSKNQLDYGDTQFGNVSDIILDSHGQPIFLYLTNNQIVFALGYMGMDLNGHTDLVNSARFFDNTEGLNCISTSNDGTIRVWKLIDYNSNHFQTDLVALYKGHNNKVNYATINNNGDLIASGSDDCTVRIWKYQPLQSLIEALNNKYANESLSWDDRRKYIMNRRNK